MRTAKDSRFHDSLAATNQFALAVSISQTLPKTRQSVPDFLDCRRGGFLSVAYCFVSVVSDSDSGYNSGFAGAGL